MSSDLENLRELLDGLSQTDQATQAADEERKEDKRARVYTIKDLLHIETVQAEPLLGPLVRRGQTTIIGGYGGAGKSTMSMEMVRAIVTGQEFLGWEGEGHKALIIDLEQGISIAQRRVYEAFTGYPVGHHDLLDLVADMDFGKHWENIIYADWQEGADLFEEGPDLELVDELLTEHAPDVVLIDPIYKIFMGRDMNEQVEISRFVKEIQKLRTKHGFALILPMHPRKQGQMSNGLSMQDLYGSMIWSAWAENIVMVQREEGNRTKLRWEKDRQGQSPAVTGDKWTLTFEPGRGFRRSVDEADEKRSATRDIWKFLQRIELKGVWFTRHELAEALDLTQDAVDQATKRMDKRKKEDGSEFPGLLSEERRGKRRYSYMPEGDDVVIDEFKKALGASEEFQF
jgi:hypothetical protein